jgi:hypothetical protein
MHVDSQLSYIYRLFNGAYSTANPVCAVYGTNAGDCQTAVAGRYVVSTGAVGSGGTGRFAIESTGETCIGYRQGQVGTTLYVNITCDGSA